MKVHGQKLAYRLDGEKGWTVCQSWQMSRAKPYILGMVGFSFRDKPATALAGAAAPAKTIYGMITVGAERQRGQTASIAGH